MHLQILIASLFDEVNAVSIQDSTSSKNWVLI